MSRQLRYGIYSVAVCAITFTGCGGASTGPQLVPVDGVVTYNGSPIEGANVTFHPVETENGAVGGQSVTDAEGRFEMTTHVGGGKFHPGVAPGQYGVAITKLDTASIATTLGPPKDLLPKKYASAKTSGLTADVDKGREDEFEFALTGN
jgi:hypothetical protein